MLNEEYYKEEVLNIVLGGLHVSKHVAELRLSLFIRAALIAPSRPACLKPFPPCFYDRETKTQCYSELMKHIGLIPELNDMTENTTLPPLAWELLHWIFTNPLNIEATTESAISTYIIDTIRDDTKLPDIPYILSNNYTLFEIIHVKNVFREGKKKSGSFFAYHGSPSENFHSIIHNGMISALNESSSYGFGTYLSASVNVAYGYAGKSYILDPSIFLSGSIVKSSTSNVTNSSCNSTLMNNIISGVADESSANNSLGASGQVYSTGNIGFSFSSLQNMNKTHYSNRIRCIAIVEVVNDSSIRTIYLPCNLKYFVVDNDDLMQLRYLLVFKRGLHL